MPDLLATKLHRPSIPLTWIRRSDLVKRLNEGLDLHRQVTLVSAPAGYGKTTCISAWLNTLDGWNTSWLSLDISDDDPGRFFNYLIAAFQQVDAHLAEGIAGSIQAGQLPPAEVISAALINSLCAYPAHVLLVLDDFHVIQDSFILQTIERMIANHPEQLHLVLITREDPPLPLARLRANNKLTEIRARDLRFTRQNIDRFLKEAMNLSLTQSDIATLEHKTEGWIVGLQLAGLSMRDRANPSSFIASLKGSHRIILSYLTEQVLSQQTQDFRQFLLETSILDALNGDLCNALTLRSDGSVLLEKLFDSNLFLIPLDEERHWYRYHHLFADLLYALLVTSQKDHMEELHQRASRWYARAGMVNKAIEHALAGREFAMAVELLETHAMEMIAQGYVKTVNNWVEALPKEWKFRSPKTNLAFAWALLLHGAYTQASPYLERLERGFTEIKTKDEQGRSNKAEWYVINSLLRNMEGKFNEGLSLADEAIRIVPESDNRVLSLAYFGRAGVFQALANYARAEIAYQKAITYGRASGNLIAELMSASGLAQLAFEKGRLHLAYEISSPMISRGKEMSSPFPINTVIFGGLGMIYYQWYQTKKAREYLSKALQLSILGGLSSGVINSHVLLSRLAQIEGDWETANEEIELALDLLQADSPAYIVQESIAQQAVVCLACNRLEAAKIALQQQGFSFNNQFVYPVLSLEHGINHSQILLYNSALAILLYSARGRGEMFNLSNGIDLANQLIDWALNSQSILAALEVLLLRAQIHALLGDQSKSFADYHHALELGYPEGFIGVFIEQGKIVGYTLAQMVVQGQLNSVPRVYVEQILDAFSTAGFIGDQPPGKPVTGEGQTTALIEPLSNREIEVLRLMIDGLKYKEIADHLFISLNTVRFHIKTIYSKLNVNNRAQAIEKSRQLRLL